MNGIWGPRSGSSTLPRVVVKAISAGERAFECSGAKRDRERERKGLRRSRSIARLHPPPAPCCRDRYLIINRIPSAPRCSDTSQGRS